MVSASNIPKSKSKCSDSFFIWQFYSFPYFTFSTFHYEHSTFFNTKFHSYILGVYCYGLNQSL